MRTVFNMERPDDIGHRLEDFLFIRRIVNGSSSEEQMGFERPGRLHIRPEPGGPSRACLANRETVIVPSVALRSHAPDGEILRADHELAFRGERVPAGRDC